MILNIYVLLSNVHVSKDSLNAQSMLCYARICILSSQGHSGTSDIYIIYNTYHMHMMGTCIHHYACMVGLNV